MRKTKGNSSPVNYSAIVLFCLILLSFQAISKAAGDLKIVLKKNGKVIMGELLWENETALALKTDGIAMTFQKIQLDLDKMKEINGESLPEKEAPKSKDVNPSHREKEPPPKSLTTLAEESKEARTGKAKQYTEADLPEDSISIISSDLSDYEIEAIRARIAVLEKEIRDWEDTQERLARQKLRLSNQNLADIQSLRNELQRKKALLRGGQPERERQAKQDQLIGIQKEIYYLEVQLRDAENQGKPASEQEYLRLKIEEKKKKLAATAFKNE